jgi:hypothetical protein
MSLLPQHGPSEQEAMDLRLAAQSDLIESLEGRLVNAQRRIAELEQRLAEERARSGRLLQELQRRMG